MIAHRHDPVGRVHHLAALVRRQRSSAPVRFGPDCPHHWSRVVDPDFVGLLGGELALVARGAGANSGLTGRSWRTPWRSRSAIRAALA
jgi:hypothetical protein